MLPEIRVDNKQQWHILIIEKYSVSLSYSLLIYLLICMASDITIGLYQLVCMSDVVAFSPVCLSLPFWPFNLPSLSKARKSSNNSTMSKSFQKKGLHTSYSAAMFLLHWPRHPPESPQLQETSENVLLDYRPLTSPFLGHLLKQTNKQKSCYFKLFLCSTEMQMFPQPLGMITAQECLSQTTKPSLWNRNQQDDGSPISHSVGG